jgi:hypothetical protein
MCFVAETYADIHVSYRKENLGVADWGNVAEHVKPVKPLTYMQSKIGCCHLETIIFVTPNLTDIITVQHKYIYFGNTSTFGFQWFLDWVRRQMVISNCTKKRFLILIINQAIHNKNLSDFITLSVKAAQHRAFYPTESHSRVSFKGWWKVY